jgi:hypothetical protein
MTVLRRSEQLADKSRRESRRWREDAWKDVQDAWARANETGDEDGFAAYERAWLEYDEEASSADRSTEHWMDRVDALKA